MSPPIGLKIPWQHKITNTDSKYIRNLEVLLPNRSEMQTDVSFVCQEKQNLGIRLAKTVMLVYNVIIMFRKD